MKTWQTIVFTHRGNVRPTNEDAVAVDGNIFTDDMHEPIELHLEQKPHVLMIADGMGGHVNGALASRTALEFLTALPAGRFAESDACAGAIKAANDHVYDLMQARPETTGMGTTIVGLTITRAELLIFNVGDSRAYLHEPGSFIQLSHDDVPPKIIEASRRSATHAITQALGGADARTPIIPRICTAPALLAGETLLLCSDGLTDMLDDDEICDVLDRSDGLRPAVTALQFLAMRAGGRDNISIILARSY